MLLFSCLAAVLLVGAKRSPSTELRLMESQFGRLSVAAPIQEWAYLAGDSPSTILVETLSGTLDPMLEVLNADGESIASSSDFAPAFSTAARLSLPPGAYTLRVSAAYGEGEYRLTALPGEMHLQWDDDFSNPNPYWNIPNALSVENGVRLGVLLIETQLYTPRSAPPLNNLYLQASLRWGETRADSAVGLLVRGKVEANRQISGLRLEITPDGAWRMITNDVTGTENMLANGRLHNAETVTLGLLAQGETIGFYANGIKLGEARDATFAQQAGWGITVFDGQIILEDFWLATPALPPPDFPARLTSWESARPAEITAELGLNGGAGEVRLTVPQTVYTISGMGQRTFLVSDAGVVFDDLVMGAQVRVIEGEDIGCGVVAKFLDREHKLMTYTDTQGGAGLLWWSAGSLLVNNYTLLGRPTPTENRLLLILRDHFAAFYVNGELAAQSLVPRRMGNIGVGFVNYSEGMATCAFSNLWVWSER